MIVERLTFDVKIGRRQEAIEWFKADRERCGTDYRILDLRFGTGSKIATEMEFSDHAEREQYWSEYQANLDPEWLDKALEALESWNAREIWRVVE